MLVIFQYKHLQLYQESTKAFVYSVKLKLELNILSKLVDLVHDTSTDRSMTLDIIDSNALPGQAQAEVRQELSRPEYVSSWAGANDKVAVEHMENGYAITPRHVSGPTDANDEITRVLSQQSRYTARSTGRESDILYADFMHSLK